MSLASFLLDYSFTHGGINPYLHEPYISFVSFLLLTVLDVCFTLMFFSNTQIQQTLGLSQEFFWSVPG